MAARTVASSPKWFRCALVAAPVVGASPPPPRAALPVLARLRVVKAGRVASLPRTVGGRETRQSWERSRSLHRRCGGVAAASSSSSSSASAGETEKAKKKKQQRRSRSRSRKRLLPSLEDLRPQQRGEGEDDAAAAALLSAASAAASTTAAASRSSTPTSSSSSSSSTNSVLSAVALIVGSSVGAGVLALPAVSAPAGLAPSATALVGVWALLTAEALLIAEVNLSLLGAKKRERREARRRRQRNRGGGGGGGGESAEPREAGFSDDDGGDDDEDAIVTLREMARETLGERGGHFVAAAYLALSYSLMVAYISKAGELVSSALDPLFSSVGGGGGGGSDAAAAAASTASAAVLSVSPGAGAALFTATMGLTLFGGTAAVDGANKAMTLSLLVAYAVIVAVGGAQADWGALAERAPDWGAAPAAIPVILLSLVFHDLIPVVCAQLRGDATKVRTALFVGSAAPLAMFILWDAVALALVGGGTSSVLGETALSSSSSTSTFIDPLATLISSGGGAVGAAVGAFSLLAIVTSCLGTALGLSSTLTAEIKGLVAAAGVRGGRDRVREAAAAAAKVAAAAKSSPSSLASNPLLRALSTTLASFSEDDSSSEEEEEEGEEQALSTAATTTAIRVAAFALVLGPPLAASLANPGSFFGVLNAVGGYGMTALYGVLPPLMACRLREQQEKEREREVGSAETTATTKGPKQQKQKLAPPVPSLSPPLLPGGRAALTALTTASVAVEVGRLADDLEGWRRAASEGAAAAAAASSSTAFENAVEIAEGFLAGSDAGEKLFSSSVVAHVSELLATILP